MSTRQGGRREHNSLQIAALSTLALTLLAAVGCQPGLRRSPGTAGSDEGIRAVWVTRWDFKTPANIAEVMQRCRDAGFNTVLFQVRGNGTVLYRSSIEPWAVEMGGRDPGFDPLAVACREARRQGLNLHAWVNIMPGWRGKGPPANPKQLYRSRPDWFWRDANGQRQPFGWYNSLNPCYPEVRRYLVDVMREIVERYPVHGIHMDYVRFPNEWHQSYAPRMRVPDYPRDPRTLALFRQATGHTPDSSPQTWNRWRADQVTQLVRDIRGMMRRVRPHAQLSAAVGAAPDEALRRHFQDTRRWIAEGLLDAVYPMNYAKDMDTFMRRLAAWAPLRSQLPIAMGVMLDGREESLAVDQVIHAVRFGSNFCAFAYNAIFERYDKTGRPATDRQSADRAAMLRRLKSYLRRLPAGRT